MGRIVSNIPIVTVGHYQKINSVICLQRHSFHAVLRYIQWVYVSVAGVNDITKRGRIGIHSLRANLSASI